MSGESKFSLEEILEEERRAREGVPAKPVTEPEAVEESVKEAAKNEPEEAVLAQREPEKTETVKTEPEKEGTFVLKVSEDALDGGPVPVPVEETPAERKKREKKEKKENKEKKKGFFARRREKKQKKAEFNESEDMYYGIQLKPIDEYTRGFDATGEISREQEGFKKLFDENAAELDDEVAQNFERLQKERRRRVAEAVENAGVNLDEVEDELGIVAPVPVSAFAGDPYAKQHGIEATTEEDNLPEFQKAMIQDAQTRTMEIKLDLENDSLGVQQAKVMPEVSEESVRRVLETVQESEKTPDEERFTDVSSFSEEKQAEMEEAKAELPQIVDFAALQGEKDETAGESAETKESAEENEPVEEAQEPVRISLPVNDVTEYRTRDLAVHIINADVLQSALLSETRVYSEGEDAAKGGKFKLRLREREAVQPDETAENTNETLDDYTAPADAKSIAHDLRSTVHELTIRMMATGISALVLVIAALIGEARFETGNTDLGGAIGYAVVSLIFLLVAMGFCVKTISNGIRSLLNLQANSDSAAAVASVAVLIQSVCAFFYTDSLASGKIHLYAGVAAAILFMNTLGKVTMIRRIQSNFRFVASRENKYAVRICDDYNDSLRLAGSAVVSQPTVAYQQKVDFLKRFLQISYEPDPAETASQNIAPIGLIASLMLCVAALVITKDPALSITALAASCCVCTAVMNMLAVNLPIARLSRRLRRSGAMVASFEGIKRMSAVNAVLVDSGELFPNGTVVINGVKPFDSELLEEAVLNAGTMMQKIGGPLSGVFEQVLSDYEGDLPEVEKVCYEVGGGVVGTVNGSEMLIGSRALLQTHGVETPDPAVESRYMTGTRQIMYVAQDGVLCAMFILTYNADRKKKELVRTLEENGVALLVRSADINLTPQFLSKLFGIDASSLRVIPADSDPACESLVLEEGGRVDAYTATKGRVDSMMDLVNACIDEKKNISFIVAMQNAAVVLGFLLIAFLTFISGVKQISALTLLVFEAFWLVAAIVLPKLKNKIR